MAKYYTAHYTLPQITRMMGDGKIYCPLPDHADMNAEIFIHALLKRVEEEIDSGIILDLESSPFIFLKHDKTLLVVDGVKRLSALYLYCNNRLSVMGKNYHHLHPLIHMRFDDFLTMVHIIESEHIVPVVSAVKAVPVDPLNP